MGANDDFLVAFNALDSEIREKAWESIKRYLKDANNKARRKQTDVEYQVRWVSNKLAEVLPNIDFQQIEHAAVFIVAGKLLLGSKKQYKSE